MSDVSFRMVCFISWYYMLYRFCRIKTWLDLPRGINATIYLKKDTEFFLRYHARKSLKNFRPILPLPQWEICGNWGYFVAPWDIISIINGKKPCGDQVDLCAASTVPMLWATTHPAKPLKLSMAQSLFPYFICIWGLCRGRTRRQREYAGQYSTVRKAERRSAPLRGTQGCSITGPHHVSNLSFIMGIQPILYLVTWVDILPTLGYLTLLSSPLVKSISAGFFRIPV